MTDDPARLSRDEILKVIVAQLPLTFTSELPDFTHSQYGHILEYYSDPNPLQ